MAAPKSARPWRSDARAPSPHALVSDLSPSDLADSLKGMAWWNNLDVGQRRYWLLVTKGGSVAECWSAYNAHVRKRETVEKLTEILTGSDGWIRCFEVRENGRHLVKVYDADVARKYARNMRANPENRGHLYTIHEVRP
jgi:hypothetical protein